MNKKANKKNKGFSLVELIIVVAIMAILAGVMIPQFVKYIDRSKKSGDLDQAQEIYNAVASVYADSAISGGSPSGITINGNFNEVDGTAATSLNMGGTAPKSRVTGESFWYKCDATTGAVEVGVGANASSVTTLSPSISGSNASSWQ